MVETRKWEEMDMDCLVCIFERLRLEDLILGVPFLCKSWYQASTNPLLWKVLNFNQLDLHPTSPFVEIFKQEYRVLKFSFTGFLKFTVSRSSRSAVELRVPSLDVTYVQLEDLAYISNECPSLKIVCLAHTLLSEVDKYFPRCITNWRDLQKLHMQVKPNSFAQIVVEIGSHCKNFFELKTRGPFTFEEANVIAAWLPNIKYLHLCKCSITRESLLIILKGCKELEILDVRNCKGFDVDEEILKLSSNIKTFDYEGCTTRRRFPYIF
ncbi:hypothetical protein MRB53_020654 [Persea americana]|uniref:Uncharacterized protein n=1 Tax=Persea americana TaxID=3435 RepID=A0ACC2L2Q0_PERAE|nr:hypothetical protein MRB53_020654 [Persea americana]|eukprot:TRINITY_DN24204_c0_g1_i4.p1 TRINITY_DN24204_c0_g1~~TRINITY_DN24204_c0_g1_i4.p1  ORF type:complete len:267 (+),score=42.26 TRINITY_DN24204_c0_g1_i4:148-948(+)